MTSERNLHSEANLQIVKAKVIKVSLVFFPHRYCVRASTSTPERVRVVSRVANCARKHVIREVGRTKLNHEFMHGTLAKSYTCHFLVLRHHWSRATSRTAVAQNSVDKMDRNIPDRRVTRINAERRKRRILEGQKKQNTHTQTTRSKTDKHTFGHMNRILRRVSRTQDTSLSPEITWTTYLTMCPKPGHLAPGKTSPGPKSSQTCAHQTP